MNITQKLDKIYNEKTQDTKKAQVNYVKEIKKQLSCKYTPVQNENTGQWFHRWNSPDKLVEIDIYYDGEVTNFFIELFERDDITDSFCTWKTIPYTLTVGELSKDLLKIDTIVEILLQDYLSE